ncbi:MAG: signal peptidase I [Clostridia bacterium]|nr:signal peptidase I [Clostridia bacterium]
MDDLQQKDNLIEVESTEKTEETIELKEGAEIQDSLETIKEPTESAPLEEKSKRKKIGDIVFFSTMSVVIAFLITYIILFSFVFMRVEVTGRSMMPTLNSGDVLVAHKNFTVEHGDVIILKDVKNNGDWLIKRVIGLEGDVVEIRNGKVYLNGDLLEEQYVLDENSTFAPSCSDETNTMLQVYNLGENEIFYLGDNRVDSLDARYYGVCTEDNVVGVVSDYFVSIKGTTTAVARFFMSIKSCLGLKN